MPSCSPRLTCLFQELRLHIAEGAGVRWLLNPEQRMRCSERLNYVLMPLERLNSALPQQREDVFPQHALRLLLLGWRLFQQFTQIDVASQQVPNSAPAVVDCQQKAPPFLVLGNVVFINAYIEHIRMPWVIGQISIPFAVGHISIPRRVKCSAGVR